jgi:hypothetical protein
MSTFWFVILCCCLFYLSVELGLFLVGAGLVG